MNELKPLHIFNKEKLEENKKIDPESRFIWIEEANEFVREFVPKKMIMCWLESKGGTDQ